MAEAEKENKNLCIYIYIYIYIYINILFMVNLWYVHYDIERLRIYKKHKM